MNAFRKKEKILKLNKISLSTRIRAFNAYVASIFLYNSELWTLTKNKEKKILYRTYYITIWQGSQFKQATGDISGCGEVDRRL